MTPLSATAACREVIWRRVMDDLSIEHARLSTPASGPEISGLVIVSEQGAPLRVAYRIRCDDAWHTRTVTIEETWHGGRRTLRLEHDAGGGWRRDGHEDPGLAGCTDVDLGITPSTNALPVNRLRLPVGGRAEIASAWVRSPGLDVAAARQSYERLAEARYRYTSLASGFTAVVEVDGDGLAVDYEGVWRRIAGGPAAPPDPSEMFVGALVSSGPSAELGDAASDFGWLIGGWAAEVRDIDDDGRVRTGEGEWWFAWALEGRAIQDVWISPPRARRGSGAAGPGAADNRYGTTVRWFDCRAGVWRIVWVNPTSGGTNMLAGRREGDRIVLIGEEGGRQIRWTFNDIRPGSFIWRGEARGRQGEWRLGAEFRLRRLA